MTGKEYIRRGMTHARRLGERMGRRIGIEDMDDFVRRFGRSMREALEGQARKWFGLPDRSKRMRESLRDIESDARKR